MIVGVILIKLLFFIPTGYLMDVKTNLFWPSLSRQMQEETNKNFMSLNSTYFIDIPVDLTSVEKYSASLGHKVTSIKQL